MEKIKNIPKIWWIIVGVTLVLSIGLFVFFSTRESQETKLESSLKEMGKDFYENYYYIQTGDDTSARKEFLSRFSSIGIKINLDNLSRYNSEENETKIKEFINQKTNKECNKENTKVIIYPTDPYGKTDYKMEVVLECDFEK